MQEEKYQNLSYSLELRGDVSAEQQRELIRQLIVRFKDKPRVCKKANDSMIGSSKRILYIHEDTFFYYQMIQEFQDLDVGKLEYSIPKAGIKLPDIISLAFPPRKKKEKNYFTITVPKNKILKYGKNREIVVDPKAKGELSWTFTFTYDIVSLPEKEERAKKEQERQKEVLQRQRELQIKEKERIQKEEAERRAQEEERQKKFETFLQEKEEVKAEDAELIKQQSKKNDIKEKQKKEEVEVEVTEAAVARRRVEQSFEYHFTMAYKQLSAKLNTNQLLELEFRILQIIGRFRMLAVENTKLLINELLFSKNSQAFKEVPERGYLVNDMWIKLGGKNINLEFLGMTNVADILAILKKTRSVQIRVPLAALVKYKGYKALCIMNIPINGDQTVIYGLPMQGGFKINSSISDELKDICKGLNLRPYNSEVRFSNVTVYMDPRCQVHETGSDPFREIGRLMSGMNIDTGQLQFITNLKEIFPVDIDLENSVNQMHVRLRPEFVHSLNEEPLSSGAFLYSLDNADGELEDLTVAKASQNLRYRALPEFVKKLDQLHILLIDSKNIIEAMHTNGINMRYMGKIARLTALPYVKQLMEIEMISRCIKKLFRQQQTEYIDGGFRQSFPDLFKQIEKEVEKRKGLGIRDQESESAYLNLKKKELVDRFGVMARQMAIDFLNLVFGSSRETLAFWEIIKTHVQEQYEMEISVLPLVTAGALLHGVLYHCGMHVKYDVTIRLFLTAEPFKETDWVDFTVNSRVYEYPSFEIQKKARKSKELLLNQHMVELGVNSLNLQLAIERALRSSQHYEHCAQPEQSVLIRLSSYETVRQPDSPLFHPSLLPYFIANVTEQNFLKAHKIAQFCLPLTHPLYISFYMAYSKLYDRQVLYRSALLVAIRGLGVSHWKTCELLSMADAGNLQSLRKAWISSKETSGFAALTLVKRLSEVGRLFQCLTYVDKGYKIFQANAQNSRNETNELLLTGIKAAYQVREIDRMLDYTEKLWKNLEAYDRDNLQAYYQLYWYSLKVFLEISLIKKYYYKLILVLREYLIKEELPLRKREEMRRLSVEESNYEQEQPSESKQQEESPNDLVYFQQAEGEERTGILQSIITMSRQSKYHLDWIKSILNKLEYGYKTLNFAKNFFTKFQEHLDNLHNEDLEEGLQYLYLLGRLFGQKYFEDALITGIFFGQNKERFVE